MYKRNELYRKIADGIMTPEQLVDIVLSLQEENRQLRNGIDIRNNPNETKEISNCQIAIVDDNKIIKSFALSLTSIPKENDKLIINTDKGSIPFAVVEVVKDITIRKNKIIESNIIYVENINKGD